MRLSFCWLKGKSADKTAEFQNLLKFNKRN